jgi:YHS domain-containing protein
MAQMDSLASRIDAEFSAVEERAKKFQSEQLEKYKGREKRLEQLGEVFDELKEIWQPRLELLTKKFGDKVKATPRIVPATREVTFDVQSPLASIRLKFSAFTDRDIEKLILGYNLDIIPVLMKFKSHDELEFPLNAVNKDVAAKWIEDRIVDFVQAYFALGDNDFYLKDQMVEDPVSQVRFPKPAAAATLDWHGKKFYFVSQDTRRQFAEKNKIAAG